MPRTRTNRAPMVPLAIYLCLLTMGSHAASGVLMSGGGNDDVRLDNWLRLRSYEFQRGDANMAPPGSTPYFAYGNSRYSGLGPNCYQKSPRNMIGFGIVVMALDPTIGGTGMPRIRIQDEKGVACGKLRAGAAYSPPSEPIRSLLNTASSNKYPVTPCAMWGWCHGQYSVHDMILPYLDQLIKMGRPGTAVSFPSGWLGDIESIWDDRCQFPYVAPYAEYKGDKARTAWLPNAYTAWVWRAYNARHPTRKKTGKTSEMGLSDQPDLMLIRPARHYTLDYKTMIGVVSTDSSVGFEVRSPLGAQIQKVELYNGDQKITETGKSAYGIYTGRVQFPKQDLYTLIAVATLSDGSRITSRPALVFSFGQTRPTGALIMAPLRRSLHHEAIRFSLRTAGEGASGVRLWDPGEGTADGRLLPRTLIGRTVR